MDARFAFAAQPWGDGAVICRAVEDRPGPVVEQQFGQFNTWTQAQNFAAKLNEGLDLDPLEVRQIITSSLLATSCVIQEALNSSRGWRGSIAVIKARAAHLRFIRCELALALTFCRSATLVSRGLTPCMRTQVRRALEHAVDFLKNFHGDDPEMAEIASRIETLDASIHVFALLSRGSAPPPAHA